VKVRRREPALKQSQFRGVCKMLKKIAAVGGAAAIIVGAGTAAMAATGSAGSSSPAPSASASAGKGTAAGKGDQKQGGKQLRRALHAQWVTRDGKTSSFVTHDAIRGQVTAVSTTSITILAQDKVSQTYTVNPSTKVHTRADKKGASTSIGAVHSGDRVMVVGTGTTALTATHIVDGLKK
jgi:hypothetical protein